VILDIPLIILFHTMKLCFFYDPKHTNTALSLLPLPSCLHLKLFKNLLHHEVKIKTTKSRQIKNKMNRKPVWSFLNAVPPIWYLISTAASHLSNIVPSLVGVGSSDWQKKRLWAKGNFSIKSYSILVNNPLQFQNLIQGSFGLNLI